MVFSKLAEEHHFRSLQFSSTHTYMNSPTNRITVMSANDDDVDYFDLSFPESAGKSGNYFRRVVKIRIPIAKAQVFWNGEGSLKYEFVVKTDSRFAQYMIKQDDGTFAPVTHPDYPYKDEAWLAKGYLKDETFIDEGVFVLGETTMPGDLAQVMREIQQLGGSVHTVGARGIGDQEALTAVTSVGLDPRKFYDYWRKIGRLAEERAEVERLAASSEVASVEVFGEYLEIDVGVQEPLLPVVAPVTAVQAVAATKDDEASVRESAPCHHDDEVSVNGGPTDDSALALAAKKAKRAKQRAKQRAKEKLRKAKAKRDDGRRTPIGVLGTPPKKHTAAAATTPSSGNSDVSDADKENLSPTNVSLGPAM
ncbi:hypothetical protein TWF225_000187 [Orbilia oligospora]|nr:hypothetical protein TWF225_000187 [Orbilia oligospora]KAF3266389.1 hypothetical protein TWF128_010799 [Orbilia oligospora]KAF3272274.1 hypothetical protein TWF217_004067 [Orbilia oligospora]